MTTTYEHLDIYGGATPLADVQNAGKTSISASIAIADKRAIISEARRRQCTITVIVREAVHEWIARNVRAS